MKKYVKRMHLTSGVPFYLFGGMIWGSLVICFLADKNSVSVGGGILVYIVIISVLLSVISGSLMGSAGMYFDGDDIYYAPISPLKKYKVEPEQIIAIKMVRDLTGHPRLFGSGAVVEDAVDWQGNYYYNMVFLDYLDEEASDEEDEFSKSYGGHVCGMCIYDETVIEYMQMRNPNIYVIPDDSSKPRRHVVVRTPQVVRGQIGKVRPKK